jgi:hypothetical protein
MTVKRTRHQLFFTQNAQSGSWLDDLPVIMRAALACDLAGLAVTEPLTKAKAKGLYLAARQILDARDAQKDMAADKKANDADYRHPPVPLTEAEDRKLYISARQIMAAREALKKMPGGKKANELGRNLKDAEGNFIWELASKHHLNSHTWPDEGLGVRFEGSAGRRQQVRAIFYHLTNEHLQSPGGRRTLPAR